MLEYTIEEVATHNTSASAWMIIEGRVLDVTKFAALHPAGAKYSTRN
jgi:cytochrome b involved in lipid metabolism